MPGIFDAIIVGAGPGGATAAFFLGEAGQRVLVLEKEALPRPKTCGGGVSAAVLEQFPFSFEPVIECAVKRVSYVLGNQTVTQPMPDQSLRMVMRERFDAHILNHARAQVLERCALKGVEETEDRVIVECADHRTFEGRYLIAADGANSITARSLGLRTRKVMAGAVEVEAMVPQEVLARFAEEPVLIFGEVRTGYLWIFPKSDHLSVGIGALHPRPGELQATLERVMARFGIPIQGQARRGHPLPIYTRRERIGTPRVLLVGDAAGLVDPFTGEGIRFAIESGRLAAEAILSGHPERYQATVDSGIGASNRLGILFTGLFYSIPEPCFDLGVRNPFATHALVEMLNNRIGYGSVLLQVFGTLPVFLLTEAAAGIGGFIGDKEFATRLRKAVYSM